MSSHLINIADRTIPKYKGIVDSDVGGTTDIINIILYADSQNTGKDTKVFSRNFNEKNLKVLWSFVRKSIRYKTDPEKVERIKSPAATWSIRVADCKSMSIFIVSILKNLGIPYKYRFVAFNKGNYTHVYPIAIVGGKEIILDAVHTAYNEEVPYHHGIDYYPKEYEDKVAGIGMKINQKSTGSSFLALAAFISVGIFIYQNLKKII